MTWTAFPATPWWFVAVLALAGAAVGEVLRRRLVTGGYRLDDETGPPPRAPIAVVPVAMALLWGLLAWRFGPLSEWALTPAYLGFAFVAVALAWVDADVHRLPRGLTRPAYPLLVGQLALASLASGDWAALRRAAVAGLVLWVIYLVLAVLAALLGSGFGLGDVTLAGLVGLATGYVSVTATLVATFAAFLLAGVYGVGRIVVRRGTRKDDIAFGPWMLVGTLIALVVELAPII
ncbi:leader peptidase (prepilin peptidase)/N-methyltransferase [Humibacillus xanthopallidus]|uniref:Leader peptidase (Prepilin peptidase)/N-methyltransferase n=1 Tax=Humibacillus xanthopallidus TaxID=412689 RepID=A0A543PVT2_9MICO|nr:A24 family peptidase [Humibacillus xanthopallidus]TQN48194.1 leader peptidase (prepilin peptidase)/N-methyltransferase [Humibacillus xanthopallidus]